MLLCRYSFSSSVSVSCFCLYQLVKANIIFAFGLFLKPPNHVDVLLSYSFHIILSICSLISELMYSLMG